MFVTLWSPCDLQVKKNGAAIAPWIHAHIGLARLGVGVSYILILILILTSHKSPRCFFSVSCGSDASCALVSGGGGCPFVVGGRWLLLHLHGAARCSLLWLQCIQHAPPPIFIHRRMLSECRCTRRRPTVRVSTRIECRASAAIPIAQCTVAVPMAACRPHPLCVRRASPPW